MYNVKVLHLEPTSHCNAACPQCARFLSDGRTLNPLLVEQDLSLQKIQQILPRDFVLGLDKMFMCGDYGDPAAAKETVEIFRWFRSINPQITLGMNTNGSLKTEKFWQDLGDILNREHDYCVFSLDGLADTNHIYRRNTNWDKIIRNVKAFVAAGGRAHWDMLIFKHNQHQVNQAADLAEQLGFVTFRAKVSKRFDKKPVEGILPPDNFENNYIQSSQIDCYALKEQSIYLDHRGLFAPCCWLGNNLTDGPLYPSLDHFNKIKTVWQTTPYKTCSRVCSVKEQKTNFTKQWVKEINFR